MKPTSRLGQHFLTDRNILGRIVDALDPAPGEVVLEIGPGKGSLTELLAPRVRSVIAIEKDRRLAADCRLRIADCGLDNVEVVDADALRLNWHEVVAASFSNPQSAIRNPQFKIVGNIPYNITSPLLDKALTPPLPACIVFLLQREVADRLSAPPGSKTYGALSVGVQAQCRVERLFAVPAGAFAPRPKVTSALVRLTPLADPVVEPGEVPAFRAFVTACFARRRKQLRNVLMAATGRSAAVVTAALHEFSLDPTARPETLGPPAFARLLRWSARL
ncbi:MAG TPA: 16S rRNA (adenine(1518)-N(6)/adenine(1519)-N(6))-dimethyltransferase RsmA [Gemmatimonadales bacterium]|nr:16S rRNA (adenine(1518)-N(6)/adenine(1519)-N(6))-dimethyltransferase RsmA [Gemmatimonadales bacterium]